MRVWMTIAFCAAGVMAAAPAQAQISVSLAKQCREMMVKAHPTELYGAHGNAALQRDYFQQCIRRQGKMENSSEPTTTGSGAGQR